MIQRYYYIREGGANNSKINYISKNKLKGGGYAIYNILKGILANIKAGLIYKV